MLDKKQIELVKEIYLEADCEADREETVVEIAREFDMTMMQVRQLLQIEKVYKEKEGKTEKVQYANAVAAVTGKPAKGWLKLTLPELKCLMEVFKGGN